MAAIHSKWYERLQEVGQATVSRIFQRLRKRGVGGLTFPERLEVAKALTRVEEADRIVAEEIALGHDAALRHALDRLDHMGSDVEE